MGAFVYLNHETWDGRDAGLGQEPATSVASKGRALVSWRGSSTQAPETSFVRP